MSLDLQVAKALNLPIIDVHALESAASLREGKLALGS